MYNSTQWIWAAARPYEPGICNLCFAWFCGLSPDNSVCLSMLNLNDLSKVSRVKVPGLREEFPEARGSCCYTFLVSKCQVRLHAHVRAHAESFPFWQGPVWASQCTGLGFWPSVSPHFALQATKPQYFSAHGFAWDNFLPRSFPLPWTSLIPTHYSVSSSNVHSLRKPFPSLSNLSKTAGILWVRVQWQLGALSYQWAADAAWGFIEYANRQSASIWKSAHLGCF